MGGAYARIAPTPTRIPPPTPPPSQTPDDTPTVAPTQPTPPVPPAPPTQSGSLLDRVVVPIVTTVIAGIFVVLGALVAGADKPEPLNCMEQRQQALVISAQHPDFRLSDSDPAQTQCNINQLLELK